MRSPVRETSKATLLTAAALVLVLPSPALASFSNINLDGLIYLVIAAAVVGIGTLVMLFALLVMAFRSSRAVITWLLLSTVPYLLTAAVISDSVLYLVLLGLAWCSPMIQYFVLRSKAKREEIGHQRAMDEETLQALANAGSDLSKPHSLQHHFECQTREEAQPVLAWGIANGYEASLVKSDAKEDVYFDFVKGTVPTIQNITSETTAMLKLAASHGIAYDGWGCSVVR